jgi:hypothetical protein
MTTFEASLRDELTGIDPEELVSFNACVPRHLVHRQAVSEVLLTDWTRVGTDAFMCGAQWPRSHGFYGPRLGRHDPLLVAETLRQVGILLAHTGYDVPHGYSFLMERLAFSVDPAGMRVGDRPADLLLEVEVGDVQRRPRGISGLRVDIAFLRDGVRVATGSGWVRCVAPAVYSRVRWGSEVRTPGPAYDPAPLKPATLGLASEEDVVLGRTAKTGSWPLRVHTGHPVLFDHPLDHVPGMVVLESTRQAGRALLGWPHAQPVSCDTTFPRFLEVDQKCMVGAEVQRLVSPGVAVLSVRATQEGHLAAEGLVTLLDFAGIG